VGKGVEPRAGAHVALVISCALGVVAAFLPIVREWGFTVDDALITARVAANIAHGFGHRFNTHGPVVDAVTPLGFEYLLAPFAKQGPLAAMYFAKWIGGASGLVAGALLGRAIGRSDVVVRAAPPVDRATDDVPNRQAGARRFLPYLALVPLALSAPFGAWCDAGMETGLVVLLATAAITVRSPGSLLFAGLAAALRPELCPWAATLLVGYLVTTRPSRRRAALSTAFVVGPPLVVALVRLSWFGHAAPLSFFAKPSDAEHGLRYVLGALIWTGAPALVVAPWTFRRLDARSRVVLVAAMVHAAALVVAGGDWMTLFRLFVPMLPGLLLVGARVLALSSLWSSLVRWGVAVGTSAVLFANTGAVARRVLASRLALIDAARPVLAGHRRVAALDVGWVGAATDADVVDLAGVTDEIVARFPGGHTSKRIPERFLESRNVDVLVLLAESPLDGALDDTRFARAVEARAAREAAGSGFRFQAALPLAGTTQKYLVYERKE
jgi:hypothetical protein